MRAVSPMRWCARILEGWLTLLRYDLAALAGFGKVYGLVRRAPIRPCRQPDEEIAGILRALDHACVWYVRRCFCLQRSAAATLMLRRRGIPAEVVIGFRPAPIDSHAWVEVNGRVVNDHVQYQKFYWVLDRL
jgi:hypothetical protein